MTNEGKKEGNFYAVLEFDTELSLGLSNKPNQWVNTNTYETRDGAKALYKYIYSDAASVQLFTADDAYSLHAMIGEMILNYMDEAWVDKNVYNTTVSSIV